MERLDCDRMFVAIYELGSFSRAAERLETSAAQASRLMTRLESYLGVQLFKRTTRALSPTDVGKVYYERIRHLLEELDMLDVSIRNEAAAPSGRLRLSAPITFGTTQLSLVLTDFARRYPEIQLNVNFADRLVHLVDEGYDLAVRIGKLSDSSMMARKLCDARILCVASPDYLAQHGTPETPEALLNHRCIVDTNFQEPFSWTFKVAGEINAVAIPGRLCFSNAEACLTAAKQGLGITRVPSFVAGNSLRNGDVVPLLQALETPPRGSTFSIPPPAHCPPKSAR
ncbi:LysR substrate-binding domain-containing protein [Lonsdalea quercina]|uniref:LysR family transcriptional regulator n=1 Tax=Lonsdalea quercina TaxID=71657 RepID=UPI003F46E855